MSLPEIKYCPGTLAEGYETYSKTCLKRTFYGKLVSHILPYNSPKVSAKDAKIFRENRSRISISGVQEKLSLILDKNKLRLTNKSEQGDFILKPIPVDLNNVNQIPANEHLTMQIARQVYGIRTAENALIFFKNGEPAYITKRFDVKDDGTKWGMEDMAALARKTAENGGQDYKYKYSYEELSELIKKYVSASVVELERFFSLIVFNFLFSNGDAHLKNFSILESANGDYLLSPAYDLINSRIHINDTDFALDEGLFKDSFKSEEMKKNGSTGLEDFHVFANRLEINIKRRNKLMEPFFEKQPLVEKLIKRSFLNGKTKRTYYLHYETRRNQLNKKVS